MDTIRTTARCLAWLAAILFLAAASAQAADDSAAKEKELINVLKNAAPAEKAIACKQLAIHGTKESVPALSPLLADPELASWARIALEAIPDPAADEALRTASEKLEGRLLVGTINSIGVRRDQQAVEPLARRLKDNDADVASAAAVALGRIGNASATKILRQSLAGSDKGVQIAVAEGCILCAERLLAEGKSKNPPRSTTKFAVLTCPNRRSSKPLAVQFSPASPMGFRCWSNSSGRPTKVYSNLV